MGTSVWEQGPAWVAENFDSVNPATSEVIGTYPVQGRSEVDAVVERARQAASWWAGLTYQQRRTRLLAWKSHITRYLARLAELVHNETGKPLADAQLEILLAIVHIDWAAKNAGRVLGSRRVRSGLIAINQASRLEYQPLGVVGVIGPWNYPVFTPMGSIVYALAAGNAVVFKPSELTPAVGGWLVSSLAEVVPEQPVLQTGDRRRRDRPGAGAERRQQDRVHRIGRHGQEGDGRLRGEPDPAGGRVRRQGRAAGRAPTLTSTPRRTRPRGGRCPTPARPAWGWNGSTWWTRCTTPSWRSWPSGRPTVRPGEDREADYGPMTMPGQIEIIERHVADALARGGRPVVGGLASIRRPYVGPVIIADVPEESRAVSEETFGPTLTVTRVGDLDEAVRLTNASRYALGSAVFSKNAKRGLEVARALRSGMTSINSVITFASVPALPFGGSGDSGFGRIHGEDGLREFSRAKAITRQRMRPLADLTTLQRSDKDLNRVLRLVTLLHGKRYR